MRDGAVGASHADARGAERIDRRSPRGPRMRCAPIDAGWLRSARFGDARSAGRIVSATAAETTGRSRRSITIALEPADDAPRKPSSRVSTRLCQVFAVLVLGIRASGDPAVAQPVSGPGASPTTRYQEDAACAAAAEAWLIGMPNGTPTNDQMSALDVLLFYTRRVEAGAVARGRPAFDGILAARAFVADILPQLKSPDPATAEKARADVSAGTRHCAEQPDFRNRSKDGRP